MNGIMCYRGKPGIARDNLNDLFTSSGKIGRLHMFILMVIPEM